MSTWFVLADGKHARVYEHVAPGARYVPVEGAEYVAEDASDFAREHGSDRPGRAFDTGSGARHAMEPHSDPHVRSKENFARRIAGILDAAIEAKRCQALVLVAPPRTLGTLRDSLSPATRGRVIASAGKDLIKTPIAELPAHLDQIMSEHRLGG
jgi:protein required for attachment to host cells